MTKTKLALLAILLIGGNLPVFAQSFDFTFQGNLKNSGAPANGSYDFLFKLWDDPTNGTQLGSLCLDSVSVANGVFAATLNFGAQFAGAQRYLEIWVRAETVTSCGVTSGYTVLQPRQQINAAPYAINALQLDGQSASFYSNAANLVSGTLPDARLSSNAVLENGTNVFTGQNFFTSSGNEFRGDGANLTNLSASQIQFGTLGDGFLSGNIARRNASNSFTGGITLDTSDANNGNIGVNTLRFGAGSTGEGISSRRTSGTNQWGLDFYTNSLPRMSVALSGNVGIGTQAPAAKLDVNGTINAVNLPAFKGVQTFRDPRNSNSALVVSAGSNADLETISVNVPASGYLVITATANIRRTDIAPDLFSSPTYLKLEETTGGTPVLVTEVGHHISIGLNSVGVTSGNTLTISWSIPVASAGTRTFKTAVTVDRDGALVSYEAYIFTTTLPVMYIGRGM